MPMERSDSYETGQGSLLGQQFAALVEMHRQSLEESAMLREALTMLMEQNHQMLLSMNEGYEDEEGDYPYYLDGTKAS